MERWEIRATPAADDADRHVLLIQGGPADVAALLKRFGALMGRPAPSQTEGYNLSLVLHRLKPDARAKLDDWLKQAAPAGAAPAPSPAPSPVAAPPAAPVPAPAPVAAPMPTLPPAVPLPAAPPPAVPMPAPAAPAEPPAIPSLKPALVSLSPEPAAASAPAAIPPAPVAAPTAPPLTPVAPPSSVPPPIVAVPAPTSVAAPAAAPAPAPVTIAPPPATVSAPPPAGRAEFPVSVELRPDWTLETLLVGAYNRFAHAAAMSVVSSPGSMYNPLFLYGVPGTGKSHMLNAIGASLSKGLGGAVLLMTSGSRLSRAVNTALSRATMPEIDKKVANSKALLIDDIHLMALTDQNKDALAKIFKSFFDRQQQVVITSLYPPRALGALQEALKFSFSKGWSVDLKIPSPAVQKELIGTVADRSGIALSHDEILLLNEKLAQSGYSDLVLWLKRVAILRKAREAAGQPATMTDVMTLIYEPVAVAAGGEAPKIPPTNFTPPPAPADAEPMAVIIPKGVEGLAGFVASQFYDVGAKHGFPQVYRHVLWETYDPTVPFGVPFLIGEMCYRAGVTRALIIGPMPESPLGPRSAEFAHAVRRILESFGVEMAWIPYGGLTLGAYYLNAHLDLGRLPPKP